MLRSMFERMRGRAPKEPHASAPLPEAVIGPVLDVWLEQAASLHELRKHELANRKMAIAISVASENVTSHPDSTFAWFELGRVQLAAKNPDEAKQAFEMLGVLGKNQKDKSIVELANSAMLRAQRLKVEKDQSFSKEMVIEKMFYACQSCGRLVLFIGSHCPHCKFAPSTPAEVGLAVGLSTINFRVPNILNMSRDMQWGRNPLKSMPDLHIFAESYSGEDAAPVLSKLKRRAADDHLDFKMLESCNVCGLVPTNPSWVDDCEKCHQPLRRPVLLRLAICIDHLLQHFVWNIKRSDSDNFSNFIALLVNVKHSIIRNQTGPTDHQRRWARGLVVKLSPLISDNGAGMVTLKDAQTITGQVLDPKINEGITATIENLVGELKYFVHLMSDQVSLF